MRAVVQRVSSATVEASSESGESCRSEIGAGLLVLVGVHRDDKDADAVYMAEKIAGLRIFEDGAGKLNLSLVETGGAVLIVSNFTLYGDCRKGRRPSFTDAAAGENADRLYRLVGESISKIGPETKYGVFGAEMQVSLVNNGPVTLLLDSRKQF